MSKMYGKHRVVLENNPTRLGNQLVAICGSQSGQGGTYFPLGYWYQSGGLYYADLKSREQLYESVNSDTIANKKLAGVRTKKALREMVMAYYKEIRKTE
jgi:hypothetical protein